MPTFTVFADWAAVLAHVREGLPLFLMVLPYATEPTHYRSRVVAGGDAIELTPVNPGKPIKVKLRDLPRLRRIG